MRLVRRFLSAAWIFWAAAPAAVHAPDVGIFKFFVNLQAKGDVFVRHERATGWWIKVSDLKAGGLADLKGETRSLDGEPHLRLNSLTDIIIDVDDRELTISIAVKPEALGKQEFDLGMARPLKITPSVGNSAHWNYRAGYQDFAGATPANTLENQLNVRLGGWFFQYQDSYASDLPDHRYVRQSTNAVRDWPERMQRLNIGDITALSGELGTLRTLGGVSFSRVFDTQPNFVSNPTARFVGSVSFPSTAEIYVDGVRVRTQQINPGVFQFNNLDYYGGLRNTEIVIRDPYGNRQVLARSIYFSDQLLRAGLQDYSYNAGVEREDVGVRSNNYAGAAYSMYHRYGLTDAVTIGVRSDGNREAWSGGPLASVTVGKFGILSAGYSVRRNNELDTTGYAGQVRYTFESRYWSLRAQVRDADLAYGISASDPATLAVPRRDTLAGVGYNADRWGSLSYDVSRSSLYDGTFRNAKTLGYSLTVYGSVQFFITASRVEQDFGKGWEGFAGLSASFDGGRNVSLTRQKTIGAGNVDTLEFSKSAPLGEGYGYRLAVENATDGRLVEPFAQLNTRHWVFTADGSFKSRGDPAASDRFSTSVAGAVVLVGGHAALTRPVPSSFAVVKVGELENVRVSRNNQEVGRTDASGILVIPDITSYAYNTISIAPGDIPMNYDLAEIEKTVVPGLGAGVLALFAARAVRAYEGTLLVRDEKGARPLEHYVVTLRGGGRTLSVTTGYGGSFYLDGVEPGEYEGAFPTPGSVCRFRLQLPAAESALTRLPPATATCEPRPLV